MKHKCKFCGNVIVNIALIKIEGEKRDIFYCQECSKIKDKSKCYVNDALVLSDGWYVLAGLNNTSLYDVDGEEIFMWFGRRPTYIECEAVKAAWRKGFQLGLKSGQEIKLHEIKNLLNLPRNSV